MSYKIIASNTFYQLLARFGTVGFMFLLSIFLARQNQGTVWGEYSVVLNYIALFYMLADFGINILVVKDYSQNENLLKTDFVKLFGFKLIAGILLSLVVAFTAFLLPYSAEVKSSIIFGSVLVLIFSLQTSFSAIFQTKFEYWKLAVVNVLIGAFVFIGVVAYIFNSQTVLLKDIVAITVFGYLIGLFLSIFITKQHVKYNIKSLIDWAYSRIILQRSVFIGLTIVLNSFMFSGDKFILSLFRDSFEVGLYSLAYKLFELYLVLPTFIMNSYYPLLVKIRDNNPIQFISQIENITFKLFGMWVILTGFVWFGGSYFIPILWGSHMLEAVKPFTILMAISLPFFITAPLTWIFYIENRHKQLLGIYFSGFIFNIVLNLIFIPIYGQISAAYITGFTEVFVLGFLVLNLFSRKQHS
jgi:O-antigen/teichoic acid export membrane protein